MSTYCPKCQKPLRQGVSFCEECGTRVTFPTQQPTNQPRIQPPPQPDRLSQIPSNPPIYPQQQSAPNNSSQPFSYPVPYPQQDHSTNMTAVIIIVVTLLVIGGVIAGILLFRRPPEPNTTLGKETSSVSGIQTETQISAETSVNSASSSQTDAMITSVITENQTDAANPVLQTDANPPAGTTALGNSSSGEINGTGYPDNSTFERPTLDELKWVASINETGIPAGAEYLDFGKECLGGWKCRMYFDASTTLLLNVILQDGGDQIRVNLDWYLTWYNGEQPINDEDLDDGILDGYEKGSGIYVTGDGTLQIDCFYQIGKYQYAVGTYTSKTGQTATVGMIRP